MYRVYAEIVRDGYDLDGLMAINWLKDSAKPGEYPDNVYVYAIFDEELIGNLVKEAVLGKKWLRKITNKIENIKFESETISLFEPRVVKGFSSSQSFRWSLH